MKDGRYGELNPRREERLNKTKNQNCFKKSKLFEKKTEISKYQNYLKKNQKYQNIKKSKNQKISKIQKIKKSKNQKK